MRHWGSSMSLKASRLSTQRDPPRPPWEKNSNAIMRKQAPIIYTITLSTQRNRRSTDLALNYVAPTRPTMQLYLLWFCKMFGDIVLRKKREPAGYIIIHRFAAQASGSQRHQIAQWIAQRRLHVELGPALKVWLVVRLLWPERLETLGLVEIKNFKNK